MLQSGLAMKALLFFGLMALSSQLLAQNVIPTGTILPLQLNTTLRSGKARAGEQISARLMQDVPLPGGNEIHSGAKILGHVISATAARNGTRAEVSFRFDTLVSAKQCLPIITNLRALATMMDVAAAQVPASGPDRGTSWYTWTTDLIGGEADYRGGGEVVHGSTVVGRSVPDGVLVQVSSKFGTKCRGAFGENNQLQALWVFASDACGLYGFPNAMLAHAGRSEPVGLIKIESGKRDLVIPGGSGMLLRVD